MLRVLVGFPEEEYNNWLVPNVTKVFSRRVQDTWLKDSIILEELREVDNIIRVDGLNLYKDDGRRIPPDWLSHGSKQFISMTRKQDIFYDCYYFGRNVYPFFYKWSKKSDRDVNLLLLGNDCASVVGEFKGIIINNGEEFSSGRDLFLKARKFRQSYIETVDDSTVIVKPFTGCASDENIKLTGKNYRLNIYTGERENMY